MSVIVLLIAAGGVVAAGFLAAFAWAVKSGQFDDTTTPAVRMLLGTRRPEEAQASSRVGKQASSWVEKRTSSGRKNTRRPDGHAHAVLDDERQ